MARAFWDALPPGVRLSVDLFPNHVLHREPYPDRHHYVTVDWSGAPRAPARPLPGLLVGDTPVTESLSVDWPLRFLSPRLRAFHDAGQPVDALGVGIEPLRSEEARGLFARDFLPVRSWTVRSDACRARLLELEVPAERIQVGADWAWLYRPRRDLRAWGRETWTRLGVDPVQPLLVASVVNEIWRERAEVKRALASALDDLAGAHGFQVAFFCNETREGEFYDRAAALETQFLMKRRSLIVPHLYWSGDEALGLLAHASATLAGRYHFVVESVLAGAPPVGLVRSAKVGDLFRELGLQPVGSLEAPDPASIVEGVRAAAAADEPARGALAAARARLAGRAERNLDLVRGGWKED